MPPKYTDEFKGEAVKQIINNNEYLNLCDTYLYLSCLIFS